MREDGASIYQQQHAIGYESTFFEGAKESALYMRGLYDDWKAQGITSVLPEKKGGYAHNAAAIYGHPGKAEALGVRSLPGDTGTGPEVGHNSDEPGTDETDQT